MATYNLSEDGRSRICEAAKRSQITQRANRKRLKDEYYKSPKRCMACQEVIPYEKRLENSFCNSSCSARYNNTKRATKTMPVCACCGKPVKCKTSKFCSTACIQVAAWEIYKAEIESAQNCNPRNTKTGNPKGAKRYLKETRGCRCEICGIEEWQGQTVPLILDHISGDSTNNDLSNLRLVCGNCDMQLPTYKAKNKGQGRHNRRKRYADGKSY